MSVVLELKEVHKTYGGKKILAGISTSLDAGKMYALLGRNGAGKSTLLRILGRYEQPDSGYAFLLGNPLDADQSESQHPIGYVSEIVEYALGMPLDEYFVCFRSLYKSWDQPIVDKFYEAVGIDPKRPFMEFSRGQRILAAFGLTLGTKPKLLLLDEVTSVLDAHGRAFVMDQLGRYIREGGTVLIATNIITELRNYPDHLCLLHQGEMKVDRPMKELQQQFIKIRANAPTEHRVFSEAECFEVSMNTDGTSSYVLPKSKILEYQVPESLLDRRGTTAEDLFIYFTRCKW